MQAPQSTAVLVARIMIAAIFLWAGIGKVMDAAGTREHMAGAGLPAVSVLYVLTVLVEVGGAALIILGWQARIAAGVVFLFMIPVTLTFHWDWGNRMQEVQFFKNMATMGGLLMIVAFGAGRFSLDGRSRAARGSTRP